MSEYSRRLLKPRKGWRPTSPEERNLEKSLSEAFSKHLIEEIDREITEELIRAAKETG